MKKLVGWAAGLVVGLFAAACAVPSHYANNDETKAAFVAVPDKASVFFVVPRDAGSGGYIILDENRTCLGVEVGTNQYVIAQMTPGKHEIYVLQGYAGRAFIIDVEGGKHYVLEGKKDDNAQGIRDFSRPNKVQNESVGHALDWELYNSTLTQVEQAKCPKFLKDIYVDHATYEKLLVTLKGTLANQAPTVTAADGIVYSGSFEKSHK